MGLEVLAVPTGVSLLGFGSVALLAHALVLLMTQASALTKYSARQTLASLVQVVTSSIAVGVKVVTSTAGMLMQWWLFLAVLFVIFSTLYVTYTEFPSVWTGSARIYNRNFGPWVHQVILIPLKVTDLLLQGVLPIWDSVWWFLKAVGIQGVLPIIIEEAETVLKMATTLVDLARHLSSGVVGFVEAFFCEGSACLYPERAVIDVLSSMGSVREFASLTTQLFKNFCGTLSAPVDLLLYPLLDLNLSEAVHNLVNALMQLVTVIPWKTGVRCGLALEGGQFRLLMCTPDFAPFFHFLAATMSSLGLVIDNWVNIALVVVQKVLTGSAPTCASAADGGFPELLGSGLVFATNATTAVVGLTDWLYAVTDGSLAYYLAHSDGTKAKTQAWPFAVDARLGIAAVTYASVHDLDVSAFSSGVTAGSMQTTAMLGCTCADSVANGMTIACSILPMTGVPPNTLRQDYSLQVLFPTSDAARLYACAGVDLYVKSVRWSYTRYETADASLGSASDKTTLPTTDCIARGTCRELDAVVWLIPRCGQDGAGGNGNGELACVATAPCMPFCMAARIAGGGRENLVLTSARRWREGTTILKQDCALEAGSAGSVQSGTPSSAYSVSRAAGTTSGLLQTGGVAVFGSADTRVLSPLCKRASRVTSVLTKPVDVRARVAANVRLFDQPFALTGDTILSTINLGGDAHAVQVERLEGSETDVFSLNSINQQLPALPKASVPLEDAARDQADRVNIPFNYGTNRIAAVNSRNYVFYASSPNADALGAYFQYCADQNDPSKLSKFGILFKSSYARLRVYRVRAYRRCAAYSCGADLVAFTELRGFSMLFSKACNEVFNASVAALEYLNEDNIAVTVEAAYVRDYDEVRGSFLGRNTTRRTYWLNPSTMRVKDTIWQTAVPSSTIAVLCPAMQRLPRVGSFMAEILNSGVFLLKYVVGTVVYTPGLIGMWSGGGQACPPPGTSMYHSILSSCGSQAFSLDDFFDSVDDAGAIFWHSLALIASLLSPEDVTVAEPLARVMNGMSQYGYATVDIWAARASVLTLTRVPVKDQLTQMWASVQSGLQKGGGSTAQAFSSGSSGLVAWSRYSYMALSVVALEITKRVLDPHFELDATKVFSIIWASLYDLNDDFDATVANRLNTGCAGLKLMFGINNPWSDLVYYQCLAAAELTRGLMRLTINMFVQVWLFPVFLVWFSCGWETPDPFFSRRYRWPSASARTARAIPSPSTRGPTAPRRCRCPCCRRCT